MALVVPLSNGVSFQIGYGLGKVFACGGYYCSGLSLFRHVLPKHPKKTQCHTLAPRHRALHKNRLSTRLHWKTGPHKSVLNVNKMADRMSVVMRLWSVLCRRRMRDSLVHHQANARGIALPMGAFAPLVFRISGVMKHLKAVRSQFYVSIDLNQILGELRGLVPFGTGPFLWSKLAKRRNKHD